MIIRKLVTLNVLYWLPDYNNVLQQFTWQTKDIVPEYPRVHEFLNYWHKEIDAVIAEVQIAHSDNHDYRPVDGPVQTSAIASYAVDTLTLSPVPRITATGSATQGHDLGCQVF